MSIKIGDRDVIVKEIKYKDIIGLAELPQSEAAKLMLLRATDLTDEEYENLSMKDGIALQTEVNELNDLTSFQTPLKE